ncbi:hypothetical protein VBS91_24065, partial [Klebsiella pneumoniae]|nr:hypothetical protein [Klebsiella pneumoniae]
SPNPTRRVGSEMCKTDIYRRRGGDKIKNDKVDIDKDVYREKIKQFHYVTIASAIYFNFAIRHFSLILSPIK